MLCCVLSLARFPLDLSFSSFRSHCARLISLISAHIFSPSPSLLIFLLSFSRSISFTLSLSRCFLVHSSLSLSSLLLQSLSDPLLITFTSSSLPCFLEWMSIWFPSTPTTPSHIVVCFSSLLALSFQTLHVISLSSHLHHFCFFRLTQKNTKSPLITSTSVLRRLSY